MASIPVVSVIVIFLNAEQFIAEAIESVLAQTFVDWELLLVNDGSTDKSTQIALRYEKDLPGKIRYFQHDAHRNRGTSASRNLGLMHAHAEFVAFLDADDVWVPEKLAQQIDIMRVHPEAAMVFGKTKYWHGWTGRSEDIARDYVRSCGERSDVLVRPPFFLSMTLLGGRWPSPSMSSIMLRRDQLDRIGTFDESIRTKGEDTAFMVKVFLHAYVFYADAWWDWYRQHPGSICAIATREGRIREENLLFLRWTKNYFDQQGVTDPHLLAAINEHLWFGMHPILGRSRPKYLLGKFRQFSLALARKYITPSGRGKLRHAISVARRPWLFFVRGLRLRWLWRVTPVHREFGCYYGTPVDRVYIHRFLHSHRADIHGSVLEIGNDTYTKRFGGAKVVRSDVLHAIPGNPVATIVADLSNAPQIASDQFDCIILTQTLQCIYDFKGAIKTLYRIMKPGGVLLVTIPGVAHQISREERPYWGDYWRWTTMSARRMFTEVFPDPMVEIKASGNVLVAVAFLHGLVVEEMRATDFAYDDPEYELSIAIRAVKPV